MSVRQRSSPRSSSAGGGGYGRRVRVGGDESNLGTTCTLLSILIAVLSTLSLYLCLVPSALHDSLLPFDVPFSCHSLKASFVSAFAPALTMSSLPIPSPRSVLSSIFESKTTTLLALIFVLLNLKSVPISWHVRLFYHFLANIRRRKPSLCAKSNSDSHSLSHAPPPPFFFPSTISPSFAAKVSGRSPHHPLFAFSCLSTRTTLFESDYNLHKSNSTYFSDLDIARTKHVTRMISPAFPALTKQLKEKEGYDKRGRMGVYLGAVHCSFRKEIGMMEKGELWTRVIGWDEKGKWLVLGTWFVRRTRRRSQGESSGGKGEEIEVCASALSKYVVKIGRRTVPVERCLGEAGWMPERPSVATSFSVEEGKGQEESAVLIPSTTAHNERTSGDSSNVTTGLPSPELNETQNAATEFNGSSSSTDWSWADIEAERKHGMNLVKNWLDLDADLLADFETF